MLGVETRGGLKISQALRRRNSLSGGFLEWSRPMKFDVVVFTKPKEHEIATKGIKLVEPDTWASAVANENDNHSILTAAGNQSLVKFALRPPNDLAERADGRDREHRDDPLAGAAGNHD